MPVCVKTGQGFNNQDGFGFVHSVGNWLFPAEVTSSLCSNEFRTLQHAQLMVVYSCDETPLPRARFARKSLRQPHSPPHPPTPTSSPIRTRSKKTLISSPASPDEPAEDTVGAWTESSTSCLIKQDAGQTVGSVCVSPSRFCRGLTVWARRRSRGAERIRIK